MKRQASGCIRAHLLRAVPYLLLLVAVCIIPFAVAQRIIIQKPTVAVGSTSHNFSPSGTCNVIVNGGFETGDFTGWQIDGVNNPPVVIDGNSHGGTFSAFAGSFPATCGGGAEANGDSSFYQQFTVPAAGGLLSFWHWDCTTDTITFDWQDVYITDANGNILQTIFHQCLNGQTWINQTVDMTPYAGQTVRIKFLVHGEGLGDLTGMYVDDVSLPVANCTPSPTPTPTPTSTPTPTPTASPCDVIQNGGFETGSFPPWVIDGVNATPVVTNTLSHSGTFSAFAGSAAGGFCGFGIEVIGDSSFYQQFTVPAGGGTLSFWHWDCTTDTITFDWQDAYIADANGNILQTIFHQCLNGQTWVNQTVDMTPYAGQTVRIKFLVHEDNLGDLTGMYVDDVSLECGPTPTPTPSVTPRPRPTPGASPPPHQSPPPRP